VLTRKTPMLCRVEALAKGQAVQELKLHLVIRHFLYHVYTFLPLLFSWWWCKIIFQYKLIPATLTFLSVHSKSTVTYFNNVQSVKKQIRESRRYESVGVGFSFFKLHFTFISLFYLGFENNDFSDLFPSPCLAADIYLINNLVDTQSNSNQFSTWAVAENIISTLKKRPKKFTVCHVLTLVSVNYSPCPTMPITTKPPFGHKCLNRNSTRHFNKLLF